MKASPIIWIPFLLLSCQSNWEEEVKKEVAAMEAFMVETQLSGDYVSQANAYSDEYVYIDISGKRVSKEQLSERRDEDHLKAKSLDATDLEIIPLSPTLAISRGRWTGVSTYYSAIPRPSDGRYMAVWKKENGEWKMLADQATDIVDRELKRTVISLPAAALKSREGIYKLKTEPEIDITLKIQSDTLHMFIPGQLEEGLAFYPTYDQLLFAKKRPWEIKFITKDSIEFYSWGHKSLGNRQ